MVDMASPTRTQAAWAALATLRLPVSPAEITAHWEDPEILFTLPADELRQILGWHQRYIDRIRQAPARSDVLGALEAQSRSGYWFIAYPDPLFPPLLRQISCPPMGIWGYGNASILSTICLAIVGAREASDYGCSVAHTMATQLSELGFTIVSGGARGIDAAAHQAALAQTGRTIAVLGVGIDQVYPREHKQLFDRIGETGACISEFAPGTPARPENFPVRNRVISGLSYGVTVVEAAIRSGALITARAALEQNRDVYAVPGDVRRPTSVGCHQLIQQGAHLATCALDIAVDLAPRLPNSIKMHIDELQRTTAPAHHVDRDGTGSRQKPERRNVVQDIPSPSVLSDTGRTLLALIPLEPMAIEELSARFGNSMSDLQTTLTELELSGFITVFPGAQVAKRV